MRTATINRKTNETEISLTLTLDGTGKSEINSGCGFLDHMLTLFAKHGRFDLTVNCKGDTEVDYHHTTEDIGISLGLAFKQALADKKGITRYGYMVLPMDEALILTAIDFSGRAYLGYDMDIPAEKVGDFDTELVEEFWYGFVRNAECTLHIKEIDGLNSHHIIEGAFKSAAHSLKDAVKIDPELQNEVLSTKGVL
ncbi:MAG: imidazoleglycerol-phosphate dehydratase HisB [Ruminococcaceae bacterium]|nr:imidazoleglycerol-phosphate dehydratase HisB [Oscillospiraceae bacterium]